VVPRGHPLAGAGKLTLKKLAEYPIVTYVFSISGRSSLPALFETAGLSLDVALTARDSDVIKTYVRIGLGVGILARLAIDPAADADLVVLDAAHLFEGHTTWIGFRRSALLRAYMSVSYTHLDVYKRQALRRAQIGTRGERACVISHRELLDFGQQRFQVLVLARQLVVIPGGGGIGWQHRLVRQVDAGISGRPVRAQVEIQNLRQQDDAIEVDGALRLQFVHEHSRARRAVALAEQIFGGIPAAVLGEELRDEFREGIGILIHAEKGLLLVLARDAAEAGARSIDEHQIGGIEQAGHVVDDGIGRRRRVRCLLYTSRCV